LRAARVLKLVDEHVVISRFEPIAALREFVHLPKQLERPLQQVGEIEDGVRVQRAAVFGLRNPVHAENAAGHEHVQVTFVAIGGFLIDAA
jgi:hypothetical protein